MADLLLLCAVLGFMLAGLPLMGRLDAFLEQARARWEDENNVGSNHSV